MPCEVTDLNSSDVPVMDGENKHSQDPSDGLTEAHKLPLPPPHPPRQLKKQARRRLHSSRPCQERLLNMAEARREIVAALKFHRAAMKQASEEQNQRAHRTQPSSPPLLATASLLEESSHFTLPMDSLKIPSGIYQTNLTTQQSSLFSPSPYWTHPQITTLPIFEDFNLFSLPSQPLGLNLNLQSFANIEIPCIRNTIDPPACSPSSGTPEASSLADKLYPSDPLLHPAMGNEEMAEIRSISEKHDMEWNDTVNLATSAWWSKFLKNMETDGGENREGEAFQVFSEVAADTGALLTDGSELDGYLLDHNMDDHRQDVTLPR